MGVIEFPTERVSPPVSERTCECGSKWFRLERTDREGQLAPGAVLLAQDGEIIGYSGTVICYACGAR